MLERNRGFLCAAFSVAACGGRSGLDTLAVSASVGGIAALGGSEAIGGLRATGGTVSTGGSHDTGGKVATGGAMGKGGRSSTGGASPTGGTSATGGTTWTGGSKAIGGTVASGGNTSTGGTTFTGGSTGAGGSSSICASDADCTLCSYSSVPTNQTVCYCPSDCGVLTPMTKQDCASISAVWSAYCLGLSTVCYSIDCQPRESVSCINGACTAQPGTGGTTGAGGNSSSGGTTATGGTSSTGGTIASGGAAGAGCTGAFETSKTMSGQSLCVAKMVNVPIPTLDGGSTVYEIDATEVTQGQYDAWLTTNPALPPSTDAACGWKSTGSYAEQRTEVADADHHPVANVDWCDAYSYCAGVGKRLCGRIGGGANNTNDVNTVEYDQWYTVCTSNGTVDVNGYPYGEGYTPLVCNGADAGLGGSVVVGTMTNCQPSWPGYTGVFDLSGNVAEWEDSCDADTGMYDGCRIRGGAFDNFGFSPAQPGELLSCGSMMATNRLTAFSDIGFRCCSL